MVFHQGIGMEKTYQPSRLVSSVICSFTITCLIFSIVPSLLRANFLYYVLVVSEHSLWTMAGLWTVAIPYVPKLTMCLLTIRVIDNFCQLIIMKNLSLIYVLFHNSVLSPSFLPSITLHPSFCTEDWTWATKHVGKVLCHCAAFPAHNSVLSVRIVPLWYIGGKIIRCYSTLGILRTLSDPLLTSIFPP